MAVIDLNAHRAARSEAENKPHDLILGFDDEGKPRVYQLRPRMPVEFTDLLVAGKMGEAMQLLLVDPNDWAELRKAVPDDDDLAAVTELYAVNLPESPGSASSSPNGGSTLKPISRSDITSISVRAATDQPPSGSADSTP
jgi:hypothetical protein